MKVYGSNAIRNVAFVGHGACGKTSLVDALAWVAGSSRRHGSIKDGTTLTDYSPDEIERKHSINLALGYAEWLDTKINLIDTPGYLDYFGEVVTALHAADAAVVVLSGTSGVEVAFQSSALHSDFSTASSKRLLCADTLWQPAPVRSTMAAAIGSALSRPTPSFTGRWNALRPEIRPEPPARLLMTAVRTASFRSASPDDAPPELMSGERPM